MGSDTQRNRHVEDATKMRAYVVTLCLAIGLVRARPGFFPIESSNSSGIIHYPEEKFLANVRQLTFGGMNAEAYFSFDDQRITFQATNWGTKCDQIFDFDLKDGAMSANDAPEMVSTGAGKTTCSFFYPDGERIMYASTHKTEHKCPPAVCDKPADPYLKKACDSGAYLWPVDPHFDIYVTNRTSSEMTDQLTFHYGYDAEGVVSPRGDRISFTSMRTGDLEIWTMNPDGSDKRQITSETGYDGGSFFSPDGEKLVWRASRPSTPEDVIAYYQLLESNVVSPMNMELYVGSADGQDKPRRVTDLGGSNWSPYWHPDGERIIFSSNFNNTNGTFSFNLFMIPESGNMSQLEQVTFDPVFDSFPMFTHAEPWRLIFASARNSTQPGEINLFIADWVGDAMPTTTGSGSSTASGGTTGSKGSTTTGPKGSTTTGRPTTPHSTEATTKGSGMANALYSLITFALAAVLAAQ